METFSDLLNTLEPVTEKAGQFSAKPSGLWLQGRSLFGGASAALAARAARLSLPEDQQDKPLRSILVNFAGPIGAGDIGIDVKPIRVGKSVSSLQTTLTSGDQPSLVLVAVFGSARQTKSVEPSGDFPGEPLDSAPDSPFAEGVMPPFLQAFQTRWTGGGMPASNTGARRLGMWARHKSAGSAATQNSLEELIAMADVPPPVMMAHYDRRVMASSLTWSLEFVMQPTEVETSWFYLDYHLEAAKEGYSQQAGKVYSQEGQLVAISHQCMTFFE